MEENYRDFKGNSLLRIINDYVIVDIETTGLSSQYDNIIEIGALKIKDNKIIDKFQSLIKIDGELDAFIVELTGITKELLNKEGKDINGVLEDFIDFIGDNILVAHNANFDINFLYDKIFTYLNNYLKNNFIDTLRLSKKLIQDVPNYKLSTLSNYFNLDYSNAHRSLEDCYITYNIYNNLKIISNNYLENKIKNIKENFKACDEFNDKKIVVKTNLKTLDFEIIKDLLAQQNAIVSDIFFSNYDYLIINDIAYKKFTDMDSKSIYCGEWLDKAKKLEENGTLKVISESDFCSLLNIPHHKKNNTKEHKISAKDIIPETDDFDITHPLYQKSCVFTGTLSKMSRKEAMQIVVNLGGFCENSVTQKTNFLILGNNDYCSSIKDGKSSKQKKAELLKLKGNDIEIIPEDAFYDLINSD